MARIILLRCFDHCVPEGQSFSSTEVGVKQFICALSGRSEWPTSNTSNTSNPSNLSSSTKRKRKESNNKESNSKGSDSTSEFNIGAKSFRSSKTKSISIVGMNMSPFAFISSPLHTFLPLCLSLSAIKVSQSFPIINFIHRARGVKTRHSCIHPLCSNSLLSQSRSTQACVCTTRSISVMGTLSPSFFLYTE